MTYLSAYLNELWELTVEISPYLLFGFLFAGILRVYFPQRLLNKYMGKSSPAAALNASLLGVPMPLCSCGVIPTGISLFRNGASRGSTNSFLISTPQTGIDSILVTYSMLGLPFAIIRPIVALTTGIAGGMLTNWLIPDRASNAVSANVFEAEKERPSVLGRLKLMLNYAFVSFLQDIMKWLIIGLLLAALVSVIIPDSFFEQYIGNSILEMLVILIASVPLYVCATASVPLAAVLLLKGLSPGAVLVFLMAGPATNAATMTVLWKTLGKKSTLIYMATIIGGSLLFGFLINQLPTAWFAVSLPGAGHEHHLIPEWLQLSSTILLMLLLANGFYQKYIKKTTLKTENMDTNKNFSLFSVHGMDCNHCKNSVELNLSKLPQIQSVEADLKTQTVKIEGKDFDEDGIKKTVESLGYKFGGKLS
ncbi:MAG: permease [Bacteroidales bacterium]|jgi:uncharacterized membrane protein YraQ (UPF0718 family)/copper chaperone CopZ|nr:permease [Bacteroidales bacterium]MDD4087352.1 permease [Bacteroidales bacterium]MDY0085899.1 permease [Bacteroidales bacterium]